jgi:hypothetical protein
MCVKQLCKKNLTRSKTTSPPLEKLVPRRNIIYRRSSPPPWPHRKKRRIAAIPRSGRAPSHTKMLFEPMNRTAASNETETLWHVGRGSCPWSPDPNAINFIQCSQRRGMPPPAVIRTPQLQDNKTQL